ncbi:MAG TPA: DUF2268 domain-containing putative Zn-dependent protease [Chondromyces sp.]|nr:DUF2268 domain-containing putative Zn-dependent protease [Chondromyces sp.]
MAVIATGDWLVEEWGRPLNLLKKTKAISEKNALSFYKYLQTHGMYAPNRSTEKEVHMLLNEDPWKCMRKYESVYQKKWRGPEVDIYIFPAKTTSPLFLRGMRQSGLAFKDRLFLFLAHEEKEKWESLFVHEYHHATRMSFLNKKEEEYTLLDSIVFEGLAESAVLEYCGVECIAPWMKAYSEEQLKIWWEKWLKDYINIKKDSSNHDHLLYGKGRMPKHLGYAVGFLITQDYLKKKKKSIKEVFSTPSEEFLPDW